MYTQDWTARSVQSDLTLFYLQKRKLRDLTPLPQNSDFKEKAI